MNDARKLLFAMFLESLVEVSELKQRAREVINEHKNETTLSGILEAHLTKTANETEGNRKDGIIECIHIAKCYEADLARKKEMEMKLPVELVIMADGEEIARTLCPGISKNKED